MPYNRYGVFVPNTAFDAEFMDRHLTIRNTNYCQSCGTVHAAINGAIPAPMAALSNAAAGYLTLEPLPEPLPIRQGDGPILRTESDRRPRRRERNPREPKQPKVEEMSTKPGDCKCEACKMARFEGHKLRSAVVHQYSYRPRSWKMRALKDDKYNYHFGIELETDNYYQGVSAWGPMNIRSDVRIQVAADMRRPKTLWMPKTDSSVTGPEFVSQPATLSYWQSKEKELGEMFKMLLHAGYRSHDNDKCGMHVNISRSAFENSEHLYRFLTLIHISPMWSLRMSQRTRSSAGHWASFESGKTDSQRKAVATVGMSRYGEPVGKYSALNVPYGESRFEFRLPRGTLRLDRFMKNIEWTAAMIEYARNEAIAAMRPQKFMEWALGNVLEFPNLVSFIDERKLLIAAR